jgi:hypothetical protein
VPHDADLETLAPRSQIPGLEDVSGIGHHTTRVRLASAWTGGRPRMAYGLMGPVRLLPYGEVALSPETNR